MNKVIEIGRLTREPEVRNGQDGTVSSARFSIAVPRNYKNKEGNYDTDFLNCIAFGQRAQFIEKYCHKGNKYVVEGHLQSGSYTNQLGAKVYTTDIVVDSVEFAESKSASNNNTATAGTAPNADPMSYNNYSYSGNATDGILPYPDDINDEDMPFA